MATKSEQWKAQQERTGPKEPPAPKPKRRKTTKIDTSLPGVSATDAKVGKTMTAVRNESKRAAKKSEVALEDSATGKPSRRSTRTSANRAKPASNLARRATRETSAPSARAERANARTK